jgi:hypothetical protein
MQAVEEAQGGEVRTFICQCPPPPTPLQAQPAAALPCQPPADVSSYHSQSIVLLQHLQSTNMLRPPPPPQCLAHLQAQPAEALPPQPSAAVPCAARHALPGAVHCWPAHLSSSRGAAQGSGGAQRGAGYIWGKGGDRGWGKIHKHAISKLRCQQVLLWQDCCIISSHKAKVFC